MIQTIRGLEKWLIYEEIRLSERLKSERILFQERSSIQGSLMTIRKLKGLI